MLTEPKSNNWIPSSSQSPVSIPWMLKPRYFTAFFGKAGFNWFRRKFVMLHEGTPEPWWSGQGNNAQDFMQNDRCRFSIASNGYHLNWTAQISTILRISNKSLTDIVRWSLKITERSNNGLQRSLIPDYIPLNDYVYCACHFSPR